jgi:hypothetical protein
MSVNYNVIGDDGASTEVEYTGGGLTPAVPGEPNGPPDGWVPDDWDGIDWFGLLLWEEEHEDPETGQWSYHFGYVYEYLGCAATLARLYWQDLWKEGANKLEVANAVEAKINECEDVSTALIHRLRPPVALPGPGVPISKSSDKLGELLANKETHFVRGGVVVRVRKQGGNHAEITEVKPQAMRSDLEKVATLVKLIQTHDGDTFRDVICSKSDAEAIMACSDFLELLPKLKVITNCPVLVEKKGALEAVAGYDRETGIFANGEAVQEVDLHEAVELLDDMLKDFNFVTPSDKSRAFAGLISPALVMGGLLEGRAALDLGEADKSQSGKGYRHKLTAAIYGELVHSATGGSGISKLDEAFDTHVLHGRPFISLDNIRGKIDSTKIESFMTEDTYVARVAYHTPMIVDPRRTCVMLTSNRAEVTADLANRSSCVRIQKQPEGYQYAKYPEGSILDHVRANQPLYLGAVFAVVKHWHSMGKPKTDETRHDFEEWRGVLDWIVKNIFGAAPLLDGHKETQQRMVSPDLTWLRELMLLVEQEGRASEWLATSPLMGMLDEAGLKVPGLKEGESLADEFVQKRCRQVTGQVLGRCFRSVGITVEDGDETNDEITVDGLVIKRKEHKDQYGYDVKSYMFYRSSEGPMDNPF